jgi:hypothetical protein
MRFSDLPHGLWMHLLERVQEREITLGDLGRLQEWVKSEPFAPEGDWSKTSVPSNCAAQASIRRRYSRRV